jgi:N-sulfoglucosamine sulfohydrolase
MPIAPVLRYLLLLLIVVQAAALTESTQAAEAGRPNILLILSDDHSAPFLGCYGDKTVQTPNLDRFAGEGMRLNRMFTVAPQCVPSRAGYLTGRSAVSARMTRFNSALPRDIVTLPELLRSEAGYFTGVCRRSFHLDGPAGNRVGATGKRVYEEQGLMTFQDRVDFLDRNSPRDQTTPKINEFFDLAPADKPWFLWVNFNDPHHPWDKNAVQPAYDAAKIAVPAQLPDLPGVRSDMARYLGEIGRMDSEFAEVLDVITKRGRMENTLVVFAGDNGWAFPHGKGSLYDPGLNVPCLVRWPGRIPSGGVSDVLLSGEDVAPTCLEAAGVAQPNAMTGRSFLPLVTGSEYTPRKYVFAERGVHGSATFNKQTKASGYDLSRCARSDHHKLIYNCTPWMEYVPVDSAGDPGWKDIVAAHQAGKLSPEIDAAYFTQPRPIYELYDLQADPAELHNLAGDKSLASVEAELRHALIEKMIIDQDYLPLPSE